MIRLFEHPVGRAFAIYFGIVFVLTVLIVLLQPVLFPLIVSFVLFSILEPVKNRLLRNGFNQTAAIVLVLVTLITLGVICLVIGVPLLVDQWEWLQARLPTIATQVAKILDEFGSSIVEVVRMQIDTKLGESWVAGLKDYSANAVVSSAGIMVQSLMSLIFIPVVTFFLLRDYRKMRNTIINWLPNRTYELGWLIYFRVARRLQRYVRGVFIQSAIVAIVTTTGFYVVGLDAAILFGVLAGLLNLIPYIGPLLSLLPPILSTLASGTPDAWMIVSIGLVVLTAQVIDNVLVIPSLIAQTVDLHPMIVLLGVVVFGYLFGFIGMIVAIPLLTASKIILIGLIKGLSRDLIEDKLYVLRSQYKEE